MSEEQTEKVIVTAIPEPVGRIGQMIKGGKAVWATKKAVIAAYTLFFGITAATASYTAGGMTADELQQQQTLEENITTLSDKVVELQTLILLLESVHTESTVEHVFIEHEHDYALIPGPPGKDGKAGKDGKDGIGKRGPRGYAGEDGINTVTMVPIVEVAPEPEHGFLCSPAMVTDHDHNWDPLRGCRDKVID